MDEEKLQVYYGHQFLNRGLKSWPTEVPRVCAQTWADFQRRYPHAPSKYLKKNCLNVTYGQVLLEHLFGDGRLQSTQFSFAKQSSWAPGVAVAYMAGVRLP